MFELMDTTHDRAIIQIIGLGKKGQLLCDYIERKGIEGVEYFNQINDEITSPVPNITSSNLALAVAIEDGYSHQIIEASDLNFYLVDESELSEQIDQIQRYVDQTCLNCLVILNHNSVVEICSEKVKDVIKQMDSFLPLPNSPFHDNDIPYLTNQNEMAYGFVRGVSELITRPGLSCIDFADVHNVMKEMGMTVIGVFTFSGNNRVLEALERITLYPAFKNVVPLDTRNFLVNMTAGMDISFSEFEEVANYFQGISDDNSSVFVGTVIEPDMSGDICITVISGNGKY